jgi:DNA-binding protein
MTEEKQKKETATKEKATKPAKPRKTAKTVQTVPTVPITPNVQISESIVFIGKKPVMNYVVACLTFFNSGAKKVTVKARGRAISRAVDTVELLRRAFVKDAQLQGIVTSTEEVTRAEGQKANVSAIEISLTKP